ncbi:transformer-2 protein [Paragonimus westermani]|uniref:Transformer-2 protein n=1 Tax=Paragonimus westermani TaxID=34504 RepID=A0A5J4NPE2_9TREM|nr:transformer-2 protein [Paragonimus westermani]
MLACAPGLNTSLMSVYFELWHFLLNFDIRCCCYRCIHSFNRIVFYILYSRRFLGSRENAKPSRCLGVFGLSLHTQERDLYDIFSRYGPIDDLQLVYDNYTGRSRGFGFVYFNHVADAKAAKADAHGLEVDGRPIRCDFSITDRPHSPTPGIYMGRPTSCEKVNRIRT